MILTTKEKLFKEIVNIDTAGLKYVENRAEDGELYDIGVFKTKISKPRKKNDKARGNAGNKVRK